MPMATLTDTATVTITLNNVLTAPVATDDSYATTWVLNSLWMLPMGFWQMIPTTDPGFDNISISVAIDTDATQGISLADDGSFIYTPNAAATGADSLPIF